MWPEMHRSKGTELQVVRPYLLEPGAKLSKSPKISCSNCKLTAVSASSKRIAMPNSKCLRKRRLDSVQTAQLGYREALRAAQLWDSSMVSQLNYEAAEQPLGETSLQLDSLPRSTLVGPGPGLDGRQEHSAGKQFSSGFSLKFSLHERPLGRKVPF